MTDQNREWSTHIKVLKKHIEKSKELVMDVHRISREIDVQLARSRELIKKSPQEKPAAPPMGLNSCLPPLLAPIVYSNPPQAAPYPNPQFALVPLLLPSTPRTVSTWGRIQEVSAKEKPAPFKAGHYQRKQPQARAPFNGVSL
ncbi:MAG: hypothetical protein JWQ71_1748 [Pedosphaera sp.]|nr:hypothetical protein [Pedosphaera sp.]